MKKFIFALSVVFLVFGAFFYAKAGNVLIDFSRESYIPYQMLKGEVLTKDIFLIYGFFGYFVNFILYKICLNINLLFWEGLLLGYFSSILFFFILKKFTSSKIAFLFSLLFITLSVFSNSTFSFVIPYSYSTLWGVLSVYLVLFSLLYDKKKLLWLALGLCMVSKVEFFALSLVFSLIYLIKEKKFKLQDTLYILIFPFLELFYFLFSKVSISDIITNFSILKTMINTPAIKYLYRGSGAFFNFQFVLFSIQKFIPYVVISFVSYFLYKKNFKFLSVGSFFVLFFFLDNISVFNLLFFVALILTFINRVSVKKEEILLLIFAFILSSKSIWALSPYTYSNFGFCFVLFYYFLLLSKKLEYNWLIANVIIILIVFNFQNFIFYLKNPKFPLKTKIGTIYLNKDDRDLIFDINDYLDKNLPDEDNFIVLPEGQILNLIHQKPWGFFNSTFTPLDFDTFSDKKLIEKLKENKTKYLIFYPRNTFDYGRNTICHDYGVDFCTFVANNYSRDKIFEHQYRALIFKKND